MTATNHAITGAIIAIVIDKPLLALPLAFFSHFAQDALPHYGYPGHGGYKHDLKYRLTKILMAIDPFTGLFLFFLLLHYSVSVWVYAAAFLALSPDFYDFVLYCIYKRDPSKTWFGKFASIIQWCERPWGIVVELVWFLGGLTLLIHLVR